MEKTSTTACEDMMFTVFIKQQHTGTALTQHPPLERTIYINVRKAAGNFITESKACNVLEKDF